MLDLKSSWGFGKWITTFHIWMLVWFQYIIAPTSMFNKSFCSCQHDLSMWPDKTMSPYYCHVNLLCLISLLSVCIRTHSHTHTYRSNLLTLGLLDISRMKEWSPLTWHRWLGHQSSWYDHSPPSYTPPPPSKPLPGFLMSYSVGLFFLFFFTGY